MRRPRGAGAVAALLVLLSGALAAADPPNYQKYIIGERAMGMGGGYTAAVDDPMASYYNPGALTFGSKAMISASKGIYSLDVRTIQRGFVPSSALARTEGDGEVTNIDTETLEHENDLSMPSTLATMFGFGPRLFKGGPHRHAVGIAVLTPYQDSYTLKAKWEADGALRDRESYRLTESYRDIWTGLSYGFRASEEWGVGLSVFLTQTKRNRRLDQTRFLDWGGFDTEGSSCTLFRCGGLSFVESELSTEVVRLLFRVGALFAPHDNWRFGLTITPPSIQLGDLFIMGTKGSLDQTAGLSRTEGTGDDYVEYYSDDYKLDVAGFRPMSVRAGAAYIIEETLAMDLDVSVHAPTRYAYLKGNIDEPGDPVFDRRYPDGPEGNPDEGASPTWFDEGIIRRIERRPVVNANLGAEWFPTEMWTLRGGVYTDFSSAPPVRESNIPQLTRIHRYGATLSVGFENKGYDVTLGVTGVMGWGKASVYDFQASAYDGRPPWQPRAYEERAIYVFIAGIQKAVIKSAKQAWSAVDEKRKEIKKKRKKKGDAEPDEEAPVEEGEEAEPAGPTLIDDAEASDNGALEEDAEPAEVEEPTSEAGPASDEGPASPEASQGEREEV